MSKIFSIFLDIVFPRFCLNCNKEGTYLCEDCFSLIDILDRQYCPFCEMPNIILGGRTCDRCKTSKSLDGLFAAVSYDNFIVKKLINNLNQ